MKFVLKYNVAFCAFIIFSCGEDKVNVRTAGVDNEVSESAENPEIGGGYR
jgi:hypothetical protein